DPRPKEFIRFHDLLTEEAPDGYEPWYFRCRESSKAPATEFGSWKDEDARLSAPEAVEWMEQGGNVGIAGTDADPLVNVDIDDDDKTTADDLKQTLIARSRSRTGWHAWYFEAPGADIPNIPTDDAGEVRTDWQYVVAPGSYVPADPDDVPPGEREDAGYYTVEREHSVTSLRKPELPDVFAAHLREKRQNNAEPDLEYEIPDSIPATDPDTDDDHDRDSRSALFDIEAVDVVRKEGGSTQPDDRWSALFHGSETDENMSVSGRGLLHCWRHNCAHNGLQALVVLSDYSGGCEAVGAGHVGSQAGASVINREDGAHIWHAWKYAKANHYIPEDDPVPYAALKHLCRVRNLCAASEIPSDYDDGQLPAAGYDAALKTIENKDGLDPGRVPTQEIGTDGGATATPTSDTPAQTPATEGEQTGDEDTEDSAEGADDPWEEIRLQYRSASDVDERLPARFEATNQLQADHHWRTVAENDVLWRYDPDTGIYHDDGESVLRDRLTANLKEQYRRSEQGEISEQLRGRTSISAEKMGGEEDLIAAANCVINLREQKRVEHSPEYNFRARLNTEFDPDATAPRFRQFLDEVVSDATARQKLQEFAGYTLMHWALPHHKALFLVGPTASGKSTFLDTIRAMLGSETAASLTPQQLTSQRFAPAELLDKWANIRNDIPASTVENTGMFKEVIGGDPMKAERKGKDPFMFEPTAKHLYAANELPSTQTDDEAFYRRILLVPFPKTVPRGERDPALDDKLQSELPGVLNWAIAGLQRLLTQRGFTGDRTAGRTQDTWEKWADSVTRFDKVALQDGTDAIPKSTVYAAYLQYCREEGIPSNTQRKMTRELKANGAQDGRKYVDGDRERCFLNVSLTGRGEQLLDNARSDTGGGDGNTDTSRLSGWNDE
ncbi:MAG: phage/plasmid primase, P4 family, partial [Halovenus sp.]